MRSFQHLVSSLPEAERIAIARCTKEMLAGLRLRRIREAAGLTQDLVSRRMGVTQANLSRLESRADVKISTLCQYVEALGGHVEVLAIVGGAVIPILGASDNRRAPMAGSHRQMTPWPAWPPVHLLEVRPYGGKAITEPPLAAPPKEWR